MLRKLLSICTLLMVGTSYASAQVGAGRYDITPGLVADALRDVGLAVGASEIGLQGPMIATVAPPLLEASVAGSLGGNALRLRLVCKLPSRCLPFFASVTLRDATQLAIAQRTLGTTRPNTEPAHAGIQAGQRAVFLLEDAHMLISLPVISIDSGSIGAEVRVASLDRKHNYRGTVADATTVKGDLP